MSLLFNQTYLNEGLLPNYNHIHTHISYVYHKHTHTHTHTHTHVHILHRNAYISQEKNIYTYI